MYPHKEPSMDDKFLTSVNRLIEENLGNENFSVDELSSEAGLSRSMLHRKLKKLTGKSASDLISEARLRKAKQLLENDVATVSEIAYRVGFNSPSYFNKVFQKYYGVSPGDVKKGIKTRSDSEHNSEEKPASIFSLRPISVLKRIFIISVILMIIVAGTLFYRHKTEPAERSIAVLPLDNLTGQSDNEYFVEGIHDALIGELGRVESIRVISRTSTLRYQESNMLLPDIARELGVNMIVEGSILSADDSVRIIIQLIDAFPKERHLWAGEYHDRMDNVLTIQSMAVKNIAEKINAKLPAKQVSRLAVSRPINPEIYKAYLRGLHYLNKGTRESFEVAIKYFHQAIDLDPADPFAYAALAMGYAHLGHGQLSAKENFDRAMVAANKAIQLDSTMTMAHSARGLLYLYKTWDWDHANESFEDALASNPNNAIAHAHYAWYHVLFGKKELALYHEKRAIEIEPFSPAYHSWLAWLYFYYKDYVQAEFYAKKSLELQENLPYGILILAWVNIKKGRSADAIEILRKAPVNDDFWKMVHAYAYAEAGQKERALSIWDEFETQLQEQNVNTCYMGITAGYLGFTDRAFQLLDQAFERKLYPITYIDQMPGVEYLREDPRYQKIMRKMNLPVPDTHLAVTE